MSGFLFEKVAIVGVGLIGSSLARAIRAEGLAGTLVGCDAGADARDTLRRLDLVDAVTDDPAEAARGADLVVIATPLGAYAGVAARLGPALKAGAILSDVGSTKESALKDMAPHVPGHAHLVPAHPIAGTENSGPESGFAALFRGRWCILTPPSGAEPEAVERVAALWRAVGSEIAVMDAAHHDKVLAVTSHLPHLIAYTIVGTATTLEQDTRAEVIKFSASGFRDFTRIAASDPTMWRDVFLANREAVLEMLQRFTEDLTALQRAIRFGEGDVLFDRFTATRAIRRSIIEAKQA